MPPAHLHQADFWVGEEINSSEKHIGSRYKVGIQDEDEFARAKPHPVRKGSSLVPRATYPADMGNGNAMMPKFADGFGENLRRLISGVIEYLNGQFFPGIVDPANSFDQAGRNGCLVV